MTDAFVRTDFERGDRVRVTCWSDGAGATFLAYRAEGACPKTHLRYPEMRLAEVLSDLYGRTVVCECDLEPAPALGEEAAAYEAQAARIEAGPQPWLEGSRVRAQRLRETAATLRRQRRGSGISRDGRLGAAGRRADPAPVAASRRRRPAHGRTTALCALFSGGAGPSCVQPSRPQAGRERKMSGKLTDIAALVEPAFTRRQAEAVALLIERELATPGDYSPHFPPDEAVEILDGLSGEAVAAALVEASNALQDALRGAARGLVDARDDKQVEEGRVMSREEAQRSFGRTVLDEVLKNIPPETQQDGGLLSDVLEQAVDAFPHTSIPALVEAMFEGIDTEPCGGKPEAA